MGMLKLQIKHSQEENTKLEKRNTLLKDEIKSLEDELKSYETLKKVQENESHPENKSTQKIQNEASLKSELQRSLKTIKSLRTQNHSLKEKLDELNHKLPVSEEAVKLYESRYQESYLKVKELEKKLEDVLPIGSIPVSQHEKSINCLKNELSDLQRKFDVTCERLKITSLSEEKLQEENKRLKNKISEMLKSHISEKAKISEKYREKYLGSYESTIGKIKEELASQADKELKTVCRNYDNKITELKKENEFLHKELCDAKSQCISIFEENKSLQSKLDSVTKPKEQEEIEKEIQEKYEKKLSEIKRHIKDQYESLLKSEIERIQEEWTKEKMIEIEKFINTTKQRLDEEFVKCLKKEKQIFQSELKAVKEKISLEYEEKINELKQQHDIEKNDGSSKLRESFEIKCKNEIKELQQSHRNEVESIIQRYESKVMTLKDEIKTLKENIYEIKCEFFSQKETLENENLKLINNEQELKEKLSSSLETENRLREKIKKYQKYVSSLKKNYQEKISQLQNKKVELQKLITDKENQILLLTEQYDQDIHKMKQEFQKLSPVKNSECQTEEKLVSKKALLNARDMFIQCLKKITDDIKVFLQNSRKRSAEQLHKALDLYHSHLISKIYQDLAKDSFTPNLYIPHMNVNFPSTGSSQDNLISPNSMQNQLNSNFKPSNSTPIDNLASGDVCKKLETMSDVTNVKTFQNPRFLIPDSATRFEDVSFDFIPIRMQDPVYTSTKLPEYTVSGGLFHRQNILSSYPEKDSPISSIK